MSIDYYRLRGMVWVVEDPTAYDLVEVYDAEYKLENLAPALARELLRLRDGVKQVADDLGANAEYAPNVPMHTAFVEAERLLTDLLNGDTE